MDFLAGGVRKWNSCFVYLLPCLFLCASQAILHAQTTEQAPLMGSAQSGNIKQELSLQDRADIFMARKQYADAVDYYRRALNDQPKNPSSIWNKLGIAYQQDMDFEAARKAYKKSISMQKDFAEPWNNLGTTFFLQGKPKKSIKFYKHAVELKPTSASFRMNLGTAYYERKKYDKAIEEYHQALVLDPDVLLSHSGEGTVVEARSADAKFFFYLAKVFASLGRNEEAVRYLRRAMEEGFRFSKDLNEDPDFQKISADPAFVELLRNPPLAIKD